jgi:hypothetical protein
MDETHVKRVSPASPHLLRFPLRPGEIKTLRLKLAG